ncbi:MAG: hypothetical protein KUG57_06395, partial [Ilumatobacteraceae bacterium]|nr:hypothetical protein [Ilumatobacteraceae bacterium]
MVDVTEAANGDLPPSPHGPQHHHRPSGIVARGSIALVEMSMRYPKRIVAIAAVLTAIFGVMFIRVTVDTDPENMLPADADVRVLNAEIRENFGTGDMIVVGV